jgi:hypothetical protein
MSILTKEEKEKKQDLQRSLRDVQHGLTRLSSSLLGESVADARHDFRAFLSAMYSGFNHCYATLDTGDEIGNGRHSQFDPTKTPSGSAKHIALWNFLREEQKVSMAFSIDDVREWLKKENIELQEEKLKKLYEYFGSNNPHFFRKNNDKKTYNIQLSPDTEEKNFKISPKKILNLKNGDYVAVGRSIKQGILSHKQTPLKDVLKEMRNPDQHACPIDVSFEKEFVFILGDLQHKNNALFYLRGNYSFTNCTFYLDPLTTTQGEGYIFSANIHVKSGGRFGEGKTETMFFNNAYTGVEMLQNILVEEEGAVHFENRTFGVNRACVIIAVSSVVPNSQMFQDCFVVCGGRRHKISENVWQKTKMPKGIFIEGGNMDDVYQKCCECYRIFEKAVQKTQQLLDEEK